MNMFQQSLVDQPLEQPLRRMPFSQTWYQPTALNHVDLPVLGKKIQHALFLRVEILGESFSQRNAQIHIDDLGDHLKTGQR
jgi:hypothetical protein